jgi:hypothetical protein
MIRPLNNKDSIDLTTCNQDTSKYNILSPKIHSKLATNRHSDESRTITSALPLSCYVDVTRPKYGILSLIILNHIVLVL